MTTPIPATKTNELLQEASELLLNSSRYHSMNEWVHKRLQREAENLMQADAFGAHILLGKLHESCGNVEEMRHHYENASKIGDKSVASGFLTAGMVNTGNFSEAQKHYIAAGNPVYGNFLEDRQLGLACFAIMQVVEYLKQAERMQLDLTGFPSDTFHRIAYVMEKTGMTDAALAEMLDIAGEVMRRHSLFYKNALPDIEVDDQSSAPCIYATYRFEISPSEAADMYDELTSSIVSKMDHIPDGFHVSFRSA